VVDEKEEDARGTQCQTGAVTLASGDPRFGARRAATAPSAVLFKHVSQFTNTLSIYPIMDPFSAEGELLNLHNYFHQGQFQEAVDFDTAGLSAENKLPAKVLSLRAQIALGQAEEVIAEVEGEKDVELVAVGALAESAAGNESKAVKIAEKLASESADNNTVQILAGTVLQAAGKSEEALALLSQHQGNRKGVEQASYECLR
jgi:tetratricopeptide (TPR) repeat protein